MSKLLRVILAIFVLAVIGYAFAYKSGRVRNHFSNGHAASQEDAIAAQVRGNTQIGYIENKSLQHNMKLEAQANGHTYIIKMPKQLMKGEQDKYVMVLPFAAGTANDKIVINIRPAGSSAAACSYTIVSAGDGAVSIKSSDEQVCSVSKTGEMVVAG